MTGYSAVVVARVHAPHNRYAVVSGRAARERGVRGKERAAAAVGAPLDEINGRGEG